MKNLEEFYFQDEDWNHFLGYHSSILVNDDLQKELAIKLDGNNELAIVIASLFGDDRALRWIDSPIKALGNLRPINCLEEENLIKRLKVCLMRFPC